MQTGLKGPYEQAINWPKLHPNQKSPCDIFFSLDVASQPFSGNSSISETTGFPYSCLFLQLAALTVVCHYSSLSLQLSVLTVNILHLSANLNLW